MNIRSPPPSERTGRGVQGARRAPECLAHLGPHRVAFEKRSRVGRKLVVAFIVVRHMSLYFSPPHPTPPPPVLTAAQMCQHWEATLAAWRAGGVAAIGMLRNARVGHESPSRGSGLRKSRDGVATGLNSHHFEPNAQVDNFESCWKMRVA